VVPGQELGIAYAAGADAGLWIANGPRGSAPSGAVCVRPAYREGYPSPLST
jgi:hypothetical protein